MHLPTHRQNIEMLWLAFPNIYRNEGSFSQTQISPAVTHPKVSCSRQISIKKTKNRRTFRIARQTIKNLKQTESQQAASTPTSEFDILLAEGTIYLQITLDLSTISLSVTPYPLHLDESLASNVHPRANQVVGWKS